MPALILSIVAWNTAAVGEVVGGGSTDEGDDDADDVGVEGRARVAIGLAAGAAVLVQLAAKMSATSAKIDRVPFIGRSFRRLGVERVSAA